MGRKRLGRLEAGTILMALAGAAGSAWGQVQNQRPMPAATTVPPKPDRNGPGVLLPAPTMGLLMQHSGGSLARAQIMGETDPAAAGSAAVSYYSVPEPQPKLIRKHDLITIIVREDSQFTSNGETKLQRQADLDAEIDAYISAKFSNFQIDSHAPSNPIALVGQFNRDFDGKANVERDDSLTTQITAEVVDVKPNGTLVLEANKMIKTDEEEQTFQLVGSCRVEDVTADNSVLSTQLSGLQFTKTHKGAVRDTTERGFLHRLLDSINPF